MAELEDKQQDLEEEITEQDSEKKKDQSGNILGKYGKIFLILVILIFQAGGAYGIMNIYYQDIYTWMDKMTPKGNIYHKIENIIINPANSDGERYLILTIVAELNTGSDKAALELNEAKVVDKINLILTSRTAEELSDLSEREDIKQQIGIAINETINQNAVRNLLFTKYVLQ